MRTCAACGQPIAQHEPAMAVTVLIGAEPGADYYPDELTGRLHPFLLAAFATRPGIGGVRRVYGASCFGAILADASPETARMVEQKAVRTGASERRQRSPWAEREDPRIRREELRNDLGVRARMEAAQARIRERQNRGRRPQG